MKKFALFLLITLISILLILGVGVFLFNYYQVGIDKQEILRVTSPDNRVDAVVLEVNAGATVAYIDEVYIVPHGASVSKDSQPRLRGDHFEGLKLVWLAPKQLSIQYDSGRIFQFTNFWQTQALDNYEYEVRINLLPKDLCLRPE